MHCINDDKLMQTQTVQNKLKRGLIFYHNRQKNVHITDCFKKMYT